MLQLTLRSSGLLAVLLLLEGCSGLTGQVPPPSSSAGSPAGQLTALGSLSGAAKRVHGEGPSSGPQFSTLYSFQGGQDGGYPRADLVELDGNFYSTTQGSNSCGTAFEITPTGTETVLHSFAGSGDGCSPYGALVYLGGLFYGTTFGGGNQSCSSPQPGCGTVFTVSPSGQYEVLYRFQGGSDGQNPRAGLVYYNGVFYGTTSGGGAYGGGTLFSITPSGQETVLHAFGDRHDGSYPVAAPIVLNNVLYGTTFYGGKDGGDEGSIYSASLSGKESVLHSFRANRKQVGDGIFPAASLTYVNGVLYGTAQQGGAYANGCVFSLTLNGKKKPVETILHSFGTPSELDGATPVSDLTYANGVMYGTTEAGGASSGGTVYSISAAGITTILYSFGASHSEDPFAGVVQLDGVLYGTTYFGGTSAAGTVFALTP